MSLDELTVRWIGGDQEAELSVDDYEGSPEKITDNPDRPEGAGSDSGSGQATDSDDSPGREDDSPAREDDSPAGELDSPAPGGDLDEGDEAALEETQQ